MSGQADDDVELAEAMLPLSAEGWALNEADLAREKTVDHIRRDDCTGLLGHTVRIYSGADQQREQVPWVEGEVIAVCTVPTLIVRRADGTQEHYASSLPIEVMKWEAL